MSRDLFRRYVRGVAAVALVAGISAAPAHASSVTGSAGIDTSLPDTASAVTVSGRGAFSNLKVTINQTQNLVNQAISLKWSGGVGTVQSPGNFAANYLQVFECWGDDDGTNAANPGPPPEQCAQGAKEAVYGVQGANFPPGSFAAQRIISHDGWDNFDPSQGVVEPATGALWKPFRAVDGTTIGVGYDPNFDPSVQGGSFWLNPFYNSVTTNEIAAARTLRNGSGGELFEVHTGIEDTGLGCGQQRQPTPDGGKKVPQCWLVIVPRGTPTDENVGTPYASNPDFWGVMTSPLSPTAWKNRIAVPLGFTPVDSACDLNATATRIGGTELALPAVSSWEPKLCTIPGLQPFSYSRLSDQPARQQLLAAEQGAPGMVVVSRPIDGDLLDPDDPVVYAPLTLSGLVVGFNIERNPSIDADKDAQELNGLRFAHMNLTPRLMAKLLTQSYVWSVKIKQSPPYDWLKGQPDHLGVDPDFLQYNPEFKEDFVINRRNFAGFLMPAANSDAARQLWNYVLADPEARAWLDGQPDPWGMKVNPVYATKVDANSTGVAFGDPLPDNFPKADPYCYQSPPVGTKHVVPSPLCGTDWLPYTETFRDAAKATRNADDGAKLDDNPFADQPSDVWKRQPPQSIARTMIAITDAASAANFGLQTANLSRAGDDGDNRAFIAPTADALGAAVEGMTPSSDQAVLEPDPRAKVPGAYPLAVLSYAAIKPLDLTTEQRSAYSQFVNYAATDGQVSGFELGNLPIGYAPLPAMLKTQSVNAAKTIVTLTAATAADVVNGDLSADGGGGGSDSSSLFGADFSPASVFGSGADAATITAPQLASGPAASKAKRVLTPAVAVPFTRFALPALGLIALLGLLGATEITKRPRVAKDLS
ncbi:MAG TPA: hypothetical protein VHD87_13280 [Acidimicrobiales bacterium]|nr:hypothetical protein [Acidimicrobiales bacterium]